MARMARSYHVLGVLDHMQSTFMTTTSSSSAAAAHVKTTSSSHPTLSVPSQSNLQLTSPSSHPIPQAQSIWPQASVDDLEMIETRNKVLQIDGVRYLEWICETCSEEKKILRGTSMESLQEPNLIHSTVVDMLVTYVLNTRHGNMIMWSATGAAYALGKTADFKFLPPMTPKDIILIPMNVGHIHWYLLVANVAIRTFHVYNSMISTDQATRCEKAGQCIDTLLPPTTHHSTWKVVVMQVAPQTDAHSCGAYMMSIAIGLMCGHRGLPPGTPTKAVGFIASIKSTHCTYLRRYIADCILASHIILPSTPYQPIVRFKSNSQPLSSYVTDDDDMLVDDNIINDSDDDNVDLETKYSPPMVSGKLFCFVNTHTLFTSCLILDSSSTSPLHYHHYCRNNRSHHQRNHTHKNPHHNHHPHHCTNHNRFSSQPHVSSQQVVLATPTKSLLSQLYPIRRSARKHPESQTYSTPARKRKSVVVDAPSPPKRRRAKSNFEVEQIVAVRYTPSTEYLVKWKGYPNKNNSWLPVDSLNCSILIAEFHKHQ